MRQLIATLTFVLVVAPGALPAQPVIQNAIQMQQDRVIFRLPDSGALSGMIEIRQQLEDGLQGTAGPLNGIAGSFALLSENNRLSARVHARGRVFLFEPTGGAHRVMTVEPAPFSCAAQRAGHQPAAGAISAPAVAGPCDHLNARSWDPCFEAEQAMAAAMNVNSCLKIPKPSGEPVEIELLVLYTPTVAARTWEVIRQEVYFAILETNAAFAVSKVSATVKLARSSKERRICLLESGWDETGILNNDFNALLTRTDVSEKRDRCRADLVVLLTEVTNDVSGMACVMKVRTPAFAPYARAVVRFSSMVHHYTFTHELGHLMGAGHDRNENESKNNCRMGMCNESAGWHFTHAEIRYKSMMAIGGEKSLHFSDPLIRFEGGPRTGASKANNAQTLRRTVKIVSEFHP